MIFVMIGLGAVGAALLHLVVMVARDAVRRRHERREFESIIARVGDPAPR